jgi:hypothetical protein
MKCEEFFYLAKRLKELDNAGEVEFRTSISRVFNYAYLTIRRRYRNDRRVKFRGYGDDKILVRELLYNARQKHLFEQYKKFYSDRNNAEYQMNVSFDKSDVNEYIDDIEDFLLDVKRKVKLKK